MDILSALRATVEKIRDWTNDGLDGKVDKVGGKQLTDQNYSLADKAKVDGMVTGLAVVDGKLFLKNDDGIMEETATTLPTGSGGGGGGSSASITLVNLLNSNEITVAVGGSAKLLFEYASSETDSNGTAYIYVGGTLKKTYSITTGENTLDIRELISEGVNEIKLTASDIYSNSKSLSFVVNAVSLRLTSTFDDSQIYSDDVNIRIIPYGNISKDVHMKLGDEDVVVATTSETGKQQTYTISKDKLSHGAHDLIIYLSAEINGVIIKSNELHYSIIAVDDGATTPIISSVCSTPSLTQGEQSSVNYVVYDPVNMSTDVTLTVLQNGEKYSEVTRTVDATKQIWNTRDLPVGEVTLSLTYGVVTRIHIITVIENDIDISIKSTDLEFNLSAEGKSNTDGDRDVWESNGVTTTFEYINWESTGWIVDDNSDTALRLSGDAKATINFKPFETDARLTGRTLEMEFAIRDVNNTSAVAISCINDGKVGFTVSADTAKFSSEQTEISCNYTDEEKVYVTYVVEPRNELRLVRIYLNGILSGAKQYVENDNFQQGSDSQYITIGSPYCSIDLYNIRSYNVALTDEEVRDNYIASITDINEQLSLYEDNNIYDAYGNISFSALQEKMPILVIKGTSLPTYKGDKKKVSVSFTHPEKPMLNYEDTATIDVQGTSSQFYIRKNWKIKTSEYHMIDTDKIETNVICCKCDYAEATMSHNLSGAVYVHTLYGDAKVLPQEDDSRVRTSIWGFPCIIFFDNGDGNLEFIGRYNYNYEKSSEEAYGFTDQYPDAFSVEFCNNTSDACQFRGEIPDNWGDDFEFRYPDGHEDISDFKAMHSWVVSTCQDLATGTNLEEEYVGVDGVVHTVDDAPYRLARFKKEFTEHFDMDFALVYYVWGLFGLYVDSFAKNLFLTTFDRQHWYCYWYDLDTSWAIGNTGVLTYTPFEEDIDMHGDATVFNGQKSTLWINFREAFQDEIKAFYAELRSDGRLTYDKIIEYFITNQTDKFSISLTNEDADYKYISMLRSDNDASNLYQIRGDGSEHLKYFVKNRFNYMDSKNYAGTYPDDIAFLRIYTPNRDDLAVEPCADITVTPYNDMYAGVKYKANGTLQQIRTKSNTPTKFVAPNETFNDTETAIYGASNISSLGDLSPLYCGSINVSAADKLTELIIGNGTEGYVNYNLGTNDGVLAVGANRLLQKIDIQNCPNLTASLALSQCPNVKEIYAQGSSISGVELPDSGYLKKCYLPGTLSNLTVTNQRYIEEFVLDGYDNLTTLRVENAVKIPIEDIINNASKLNRVRLIDATWTAESEEKLALTVERLKLCMGLDANGNNTDHAVITGRVYVPSISDELYNDIYRNFPNLVVDDGNVNYILDYRDWDGSTLYTVRVSEGSNAYDPIAQGYIEKPYRSPDENYSYEFVGWSSLPTNINKHVIITALYKTMVAVNFAVDGKVIHSEYAIYGGSVENPVANGTIDSPVKEGTDDIHYLFSGWDGSLHNVTIPRTLNALFSNVYPVRFYSTSDATTPHHVQWVVEGQDAHDPVAAKECEVPADIITAEEKKLSFTSWDNIPTNVSAIFKVYAQYATFWAARFWNGDSLYLLEWILDGTNVISPDIYFDDYIVPTKPSTAQYDYTFSKWDGDFSAMSAPRDLTATYYNTIRRYNVYFYNDTELLQTVESVQYGSSASYTGETPTKLGVANPEEYVFKGWLPAPESITGETYCYALFKFTGYLFGKLANTEDADQGWGTIDNPNWDAINAYWSTINSDVESYKSGAMNEEDFITKYPIGGRMIIPINLSDGMVVADVEIIGHNHDNLADDSGKAPLTFFCVDLPQILHKMNEESSNDGGYEASEMRTFLNGDLFSALPEQLRSIIAPVYKISDGGSSNKNLITTVDSCWLASYDEVGLPNGDGNLSGQGELYSSIFSSNRESRKKYITDSASSGGYWLRSSYYSLNSSSMFWRVTNSGGSYSDIAFNQFYIAVGLCIG